jgi:pimeloyl-ACP methyl ester carboxylesterase
LPRQVEALSQHFTVIAPDSRGHGRSTDGSGPLHYHQMAEDMVALLNHLHVHGADIVGWSDGGIIGLDLAIHHPVRVGRVATFGANYRPEGVIGYPSDCAQTGDSLRVPSGLGPSDILARKLQFLWCTEPQFTTAELASIHVPVLVVVGDHDAVLPEHSAALARTIPNGRLYVIPDASHAVLLEKPDLCNQLLLEFLGSPGRRK